MKNAGTEEVKTSKDFIKERLQQEYPETDFNAENASDVIDDSIVSMLKKYDAELEGFRNADRQIKDLFKKNPKGGRLLMGMMAGDKDPITYLADIFGPDLMDAMQSEEGKAKLAESYSKWTERKAAEEAGEAKRAENFENSINELVKFAEEKGLKDEDAIGMLQRLNQVLDWFNL